MMSVTQDMFKQQCKRRFGRANPERMQLEYWEWMIRTGRDPFSVRQELDLESNFLECAATKSGFSSPDWCFDRNGRTRTRMADGRIVCIGGEHEDWYDPDFCIYNDVIVLKPAAGQAEVSLESGAVEIYGYPEAVFPPTDFHSATLVGGKTYVIGRLGYAETRRVGQTPVLALDTASYRIEPVATTGPCPGWVYRHSAWYDAQRHALSVRGGMIYVPHSRKGTRNLAAHRLRLDDMRWELIAERETHRRFVIRRRGRVLVAPPSDAFRPKSVPHEWLEPEVRGVVVHQVVVDAVRVSFEEWYDEIITLVEGDLPAETAERVLADVAENLRQSTGCEWTVEEIATSDDE